MDPHVIRLGPDENNPLFNTFFEYMDEVSAYVMGYIYAKGTIIVKKKIKCISIKNRNDIRTLYRIREILGVKTDVSDSGELLIESNALCNSLISHGFNCDTEKSKKTTLVKLPVLEEKLVRHFVRGYFDACGYCIAEINGRPEDSQRLMVYMPFQNQRFMAEFQKALQGTGGPEGHLHYYKDRKHVLKYYYKASQSFYWYIYNEAYIYNIEKKAKFEHGFGMVYKAKQKYWKEKRKKK